jgi:hypothetical protein
MEQENPCEDLIGAVCGGVATGAGTGRPRSAAEAATSRRYHLTKRSQIYFPLRSLRASGRVGLKEALGKSGPTLDRDLDPIYSDYLRRLYAAAGRRAGPLAGAVERAKRALAAGLGEDQAAAIRQAKIVTTFDEWRGTVRTARDLGRFLMACSPSGAAANTVYDSSMRAFIVCPGALLEMSRSSAPLRLVVALAGASSRALPTDAGEAELARCLGRPEIDPAGLLERYREAQAVASWLRMEKIPAPERLEALRTAFASTCEAGPDATDSLGAVLSRQAPLREALGCPAGTAERPSCSLRAGAH